MLGGLKILRHLVSIFVCIVIGLLVSHVFNVECYCSDSLGGQWFVGFPQNLHLFVLFYCFSYQFSNIMQQLAAIIEDDFLNTVSESQLNIHILWQLSLVGIIYNNKYSYYLLSYSVVRYLLFCVLTKIGAGTWLSYYVNMRILDILYL